LKGLAVSTRKRSPLAPDVPTIAEVGYPDFEFESYHVLAAPAGIPESVAVLLEREVLQALASPELQDKFRAQDIVIAPTAGAQAKARIKFDFQTWAKVVKAAHMSID
jgi:tripartite-type tricarboxylate transporter receptor subunit TctC